MPRIFQQAEVGAGLTARVQPGLHRETVSENHRLGCGLVIKGLPRVDKALAMRWVKGRRDRPQYSDFPKARSSILTKRAVSLAHSCREVKSGDYKGRVGGLITIVVKGTLATECHVLQQLPGTKERKGLVEEGEGCISALEQGLY